MLHYRIVAAYTRGQEDSRSNMLSQEALFSWEQAFFSPQWLPIGGNTAVDSFSRLNLELCLFWGLFVQQGPCFVGLFSTNNTKGDFSSLGTGFVKVCSFPSSSVASYRREHSSGLLFKAQFGVVPVLGFVCVTWAIFCRAILHKQHQRGFSSLRAGCVKICLFTLQQTSLQGTSWPSGYSCWTGGCSSPFWIL